MEIIQTIIESAVRFPNSDNYISIVSEAWDEMYGIDRKSGTSGTKLSVAEQHHQTLAEHRKRLSL